MVIRIDVSIQGIDSTIKYIRKVPKDLTKGGTVGLRIFSREIQKSMKLRARRWSGYLADNINVETISNKKIHITSNAAYAEAQDGGYTPHYVHVSMPTRSGATIGDWLRSKGYNASPGGFIKVRKFRPYTEPGVNAVLGRADTIFDREITKQLKKG